MCGLEWKCSTKLINGWTKACLAADDSEGEEALSFTLWSL